jgi:hypothetical protein
MVTTSGRIAQDPTQVGNRVVEVDLGGVLGTAGELGYLTKLELVVDTQLEDHLLLGREPGNSIAEALAAFVGDEPRRSGRIGHDQLFGDLGGLPLAMITQVIEAGIDRDTVDPGAQR